MRSSRAALVAAGTAVVLAVYEFIAILTKTESIPTITEFIQDLPEPAELGIVSSVMLWLAWHFGWFAKLLRLMGR